MTDVKLEGTLDPATRHEVERFLQSEALAHWSPEDEAVRGMAGNARLVTLAAAARWSIPHDDQAHVCLLLDGLAVVTDAEGTLPKALVSGSGFGLPARRTADRRIEVRALDPTRLVLVDEQAYPQAGDSLPAFSELLTSVDLVGVDREQELDESHREQSSGDGTRESLVHLPVADVMTRGPVFAAPDTDIRTIAGIMAAKRISCVPIVEGKRFVGIVTEADITARVVAVDRDSATPVADIMTRGARTVASDDVLFDALQIVSQYGVAHVPVVDGGELVGIITQTDIVRQQTASAVYLIADIEQLDDAASIARVTAESPRVLANLIDNGATAIEIGHVMTSITDAVTRRLIELAIDELGEAPVPFAWLACGSQGRQEQTGVSDQDNCLFIDNRYDEGEHGAWFKAFSERVCTDLDTAGYVFCPGEMMAMNPRWRQPVSVWRRYFDEWINHPGPEAQMLASVMFDLRVIHGDAALLESVQAETLGEASSNSIFVAHLMSNALKHRPPLGLFGQLATERRGPQRHKLDLKHGGVVPINDMARAHALSVASAEVSTLRRLQQGGAGGLLSDGARADLSACFEFINLTRLRHQAEQVRRGRRVDNFIDPAELGRIEREQLKDCFSVVKKLQAAMASRQGVLG